MSTDEKIAILDIGPSTIMLLLVSCNPNQEKIEIINEFGAFTNLSYGLEKTGIISTERIKIALDVCMEVINIAKESGAEKIFMFASCSLKNIKNKTEFILACRSKLNMLPTFLNENEEARLIYKGINKYEKSDIPLIAFEIGGNYTHISFGCSGRMIRSVTLRVGVLDYGKLCSTEYYGDKIIAMREYIISNLFIFAKELTVWLEKRTPIFIWTGGLSSGFVGVHMHKINLSRKDVEGSSFLESDIKKSLSIINECPIQERNRIVGLDQERKETLPVALEIILTVIRFLRVDRVTTSTYGLRVGLVKAHLEKTSVVSLK